MTRLVSCGSRTSIDSTPGLLGRIVVAARENGVADENHVADLDAERLMELSDAIGLVDARVW